MSRCAGGTPMTAAPLPPGGCVDVQCVWNDAPDPIDVRACVDNDGYGCTGSSSDPGANNECNEGNNQDNQSGPFDCQPIG